MAVPQLLHPVLRSGGFPRRGLRSLPVLQLLRRRKRPPLTRPSGGYEFSKQAGNDLSTPLPQFGFDGVKAGDRWCLCALRWKEAFENDCAPMVVLEAQDLYATVLKKLGLYLEYFFHS